MLLKLHQDKCVCVEESSDWADQWYVARNSIQLPGHEDAVALDEIRIRLKDIAYMVRQCWIENPERRFMMRSFLEDHPLNHSLITILMQKIEPLDRARCRAHDEDWEHFQPEIYNFFAEPLLPPTELTTRKGPRCSSELCVTV